MIKKGHHGVGVIITNKEKSLFYIQQKDEGFNPKKYRGWFSNFGGAMEKGEEPIIAIKREIKEELDRSVVELICDNIRFVNTLEIESDGIKYYEETFECILTDEELKKLSNLKVKEGRGVLVTREEFEKLDYIYGLKKVFDIYLDNKG